MDAWEAVRSIASNTLVIGAVTYLAKASIERFIARESKEFAVKLERDSKEFEIELKAQFDATAERLKNELQLRTIEHQVRFSKLHEQRAATIAELYRKLQVTLREVERFISPGRVKGDPSLPEKHKNAHNSIVDAIHYLNENRIYFPHDVCELVEKFLTDTGHEVVKIGIWVRYGTEDLPEPAQKNRQDAEVTAWSRIKLRAPAAMRALEEEFRILLGDASSNTTRDQD